MPSRRFHPGLLPLLLTACFARPPAAPALPPETAPLLLAALDGEALFTLAGGLKPVSEGFWQRWIEVAAPDLGAIATARKALAPWRNDELWADVHVFHQVHDGKRAAMAYVVDRRALATVLRDQAPFFAPYGLLPDTHPAEVMAVVERMPKLDRHRGQGLLFGYPRHAIEFFVTAAAVADDATGKPAPRRFVQIPTFASPTGRFVYAVAADAGEHADDVVLRDAAAVQLARYRELRHGSRVDDPVVLQDLVTALRSEFARSPTTAP
ncbi:MAG: hypothetical protein MUC36_16815 [Planctomycetes bacterium]|jgi:hypothetical protein|nr:hypothetical protein [Planctomycetota bacterium]